MTILDVRRRDAAKVDRCLSSDGLRGIRWCYNANIFTRGANHLDYRREEQACSRISGGISDDIHSRWPSKSYPLASHICCPILTKFVPGLSVPCWKAQVAVHLSPGGTCNAAKDIAEEATGNHEYFCKQLSDMGISYLHVKLADDQDERHGGKIIPIE